MSLRFDRLFSSLGAGALLLVSLAAHAASFDCAKATSAAEKAICADSKLSELDSKLLIVWEYVFSSSVHPFPVDPPQLQLQKFRDACGADVSCLSVRYNKQLATLVSALFAVQVDPAGNRLEALRPKKSEESTDARKCTADWRFCIQILHEHSDSPPLMQIDEAGANSSTYRFMLPEYQNMDVTLWPYVLRFADDNGAILAGALYNDFNGHTGGGYALGLRLFKITLNGTTFHAHEVLSVPMMAEGLIFSACLFGRNAHHRLSACANDHKFGATLNLDQTVKSGFPRLVYMTTAMRLSGSPSRERNLVIGNLSIAFDPRCTYMRIFRFDNNTGTWMPDQTLPECSDYTVP